jgi:chloramphenicol 3-O phosphotransferase
MAPGTILLLNGTSSAGKTSIAVRLQRILPEPYVLFGADVLGAICPPAYNNGDRAVEGVAWVPLAGAGEPTTAMVAGPYGQLLVAGFHRAVAALSRQGLGVIVDHSLHERRWLEDCLAIWRSLPVLFVGIRCPLAVVEQRERERGDRVLGVARRQFERVHAHGTYDLEVDTATQGPGACARLIADHLRTGQPFTRFQQFAVETLG